MSNTYAPDQIQTRALETWNGMDPLSHAALGLAGEMGEFADVVKKMLYKPGFWVENETEEILRNELGDVLFYVAVLAHELQITLDDLSLLNHAKLKEREEIGEGYICT